MSDMDPIQIPDGTLQMLRDLEQQKQPIQEKQNLIIQTLLNERDVDIEGGVQYDLQEGVITNGEA